MKKFLIFLTIFLCLFGCSNSDEAVQKKNDMETKELNLEEQIKKILKENQIDAKSIIYYEIKDAYIYTVSLLYNEGVELAILKSNSGELKWVGGGEGATIVSGEDSKVFSIIRPNNQVPDMNRVKEVKVFGRPAKLQVYYEEITNDFTSELKYWISIDEKQPSYTDIEFVTEG
ncbi:hypothetical protein [Bacillus sp. FJAT-22090]|uniref:hypothetical protein n=1 Tax=Bacillus sp. FJAT-22090 TaxID=1581038 RepID=UPI0011A812BA|nr:hypothetical protein [Bacillus sp. FJAT-22090]